MFGKKNVGIVNGNGILQHAILDLYFAFGNLF
jgi:hypothetical protein